MKKFIKNIHLWLSLPFGVVITIICFSGAMLIFEKEISESLQRRYYFVERVTDSKITFADAIAAVEPLLTEDQHITGVVISPDAERTWKVTLSAPKHAAMYVDQYSGEVLGRPERLKFFATMFRLHRWLMDSRPEDKGAIYWGKMIVGVSTIVCAVLLITGIVLWIPRSVAMWKNRSRIALRRGWRRFLYDLHVTGGIYAALLVLAMALTGLTWSFEWYRNGVYRLFGVDTSASSPKPQRATSDASSPYAVWEDVYADVAARYEHHGDITLALGSASVKLAGIGNPRAQDRYTFDSATGEITSVVEYADSPRRQKIGGWLYALHVGNWGGLFTRVLWFLAAMLGATLPITGYYLWFKRVFAKRCDNKCEKCLK
jgi:uncharacterized iron-regulated membrane protein